METKTFILGIIAGVLCTLSFLPQLMKIIKTKRTEDLSLVTFSVFFVGVFLWLIYGILIKQLPVILANSITLILIFIILITKIKYG